MLGGVSASLHQLLETGERTFVFSQFQQHLPEIPIVRGIASLLEAEDEVRNSLFLLSVVRQRFQVTGNPMRPRDPPLFGIGDPRPLLCSPLQPELGQRVIVLPVAPK